MEIHYTIRQNDILPHIESFLIVRQTSPCPPAVMEILRHKIIADLSKNPNLREIVFPFQTCPIHATLEVITE